MAGIEGFGSSWGRGISLNVSEEGDGEELTLPEGDEVITEEETQEEVEEEVDVTTEEEPQEEELDEETQQTLAFINQLKERVGFEVSEEDLATYGTDLNAIYEGKTLKKAEELIDGYVGSLNRKESELVSKLLKGYSVEDVLELETNFPTYSEEAVLADPELQKKVITENEKLKGRTEKQISIYLKGLGDDLSEDALEAAKELNGKREERAAAKEKAIEEAKKEAALRSKQITENSTKYVDGLTEFIPGVKLTPTAKAAIKAKFPVTMEKINGDLGKYIPILAMLDNYGLLDGNFDAVKNVKVASANTALTKAIEASNTKRGVTSSKSKDASILAYIQNLKK